MNNREAMQKAFEGQKFKVFSPFKCDISKNENGDYVEDETIFAFAWFCRGIASHAQQPTNVWQQAIDDELVNAHLGVARNEVTHEEAKAQLNKLISWHIDVAKYFESQTEQEPYAYDVPTKDGTELAYAIYFTKYNNPLPEGSIPLYASQPESQLPDISALKRIAKELKTYIPEADEYKGKFIHKVWAREIESALSPSSNGVDK